MKIRLLIAPRIAAGTGWAPTRRMGIAASFLSRVMRTAALAALLGVAGGACSREAVSNDAKDFSVVDHGFSFNDPDFSSNDDFTVVTQPDPCGDNPPTPACQHSSWGPDKGAEKLPMPGDQQSRAIGVPQGVRRDSEGAIVVDSADGKGSYSIILSGCIDQGTLEPYDTLWWNVDWAATIPSGGSLTVRARSASSGDGQSPLWAQALPTPPHSSPRIDLQAELTPNLHPQEVGMSVNDQYLRLDITLTTSAKGTSPRLQLLTVAWKCFTSVARDPRRDRESSLRAPQPR